MQDLSTSTISANMKSNTPPRKYPLNQPPKHNPPPRLTLVFPETQLQVFTAYIGIQIHGLEIENINCELDAYQDETTEKPLFSTPVSKIKAWIKESTPNSTEQFIVLNDTQNHTRTHTQKSTNTSTTHEPNPIQTITLVWACYWSNKTTYKKALETLNLPSIHESLPETLRPSTGLWIETFVSDIARLETVYSATDYLPGLARLEGTSTARHLHTGYWGAARDRIPGSGVDLFDGGYNSSESGTGTGTGAGTSKGEKEDPANTPTESLPVAASETVGAMSGVCIKGTNPSDMVHIRSGQFWGNCDEEEEKAYLDNLEPKLRAGLAYLWENSEESGSFGVRYLRNTPCTMDVDNGLDISGLKTLDTTASGEYPKETCVTAFFKNMSDLEKWAWKHPSHLAIHAGAISHGRRFGDKRRFRTWHEVSVIRRGEARFEYVNCVDGTGVGRGMVSVQTGTWRGCPV